MKITELLLTNKNRPRLPIKPKYLVIHWTANENVGANARKNRNYFQNTDRDCSAHYLVDSDEVVRAIPENELAWHVGAKAYKHSSARNSNTIGIEMCVNADGDFDKMVANTIELAADICKRYGLNPITDMIRHYDVTGKNCPKFYVEDDKAWETFRIAVQESIKPKPTPAPANPAYPGKLIKIGAKGKDVERIQRAVGVKPDGVFGKATESAVKAYQKRKGLSADGIVGAKTWGVMF